MELTAATDRLGQPFQEENELTRVKEEIWHNKHRPSLQNRRYFISLFINISFFAFQASRVKRKASGQLDSFEVYS